MPPSVRPSAFILEISSDNCDRMCSKSFLKEIFVMVIVLLLLGATFHMTMIVCAANLLRGDLGHHDRCLLPSLYYVAVPLARQAQCR